jgi:hypothetical protein
MCAHGSRLELVVAADRKQCIVFNELLCSLGGGGRVLICVRLCAARAAVPEVRGLPAPQGGVADRIAGRRPRQGRLTIATAWVYQENW